LSDDTEHFRWISLLKNGLEDWFAEDSETFGTAQLYDWFESKEHVLVSAKLRWYPVEGRPDLCQVPDVMVVLAHPSGERESYNQWEENGRPPNVVFEFISRGKPASDFLTELEFSLPGAAMNFTSSITGTGDSRRFTVTAIPC